MSDDLNPSAAAPVPESETTGRKVHPWLMNGMILAGVVMMVVAVVGMLLVNRPQSAAAPAPGGPIRAGMRLANFTLKDINGNTVHLSDYAGRPVLVNAWATWCPPCQAEMPALNAFYQQHRDKGFVILAVDAGETQPQVAGFTAQYGLTFPVLMDPDEQLMDQLGIHDYPTSILIGTDGMVKRVHIGMFSAGALEQEILPLIQ